VARMMNITFKSCGLNIKYNLFKSALDFHMPGEDATIINVARDICRYIYAILGHEIRDNCVVFALNNNGTMIYGAKIAGDINIYEYDGPNPMGAIAYFYKQGQYKYCGLLTQLNDDLYTIIVD
jgi:hypothetical protein